MSKQVTKELLEELKEKHRYLKHMMLNLMEDAPKLTKEIIGAKLYEIYKELK